MFNVMIVTINAHVGQVGYHPQMYKNHLVAIKEKDGITVESLAAMDADDRLGLKQNMEDTTMASSCEEYLTCLFMLMVDNRSCHHQLPSLPALDPPLQPLLVHAAFPLDPLPICSLQQITRCLAGTADHEKCLPGIGPQAHLLE